MAANPKGEILYDQARYWGQGWIHNHQFLQAGVNTLNVELGSLPVESLNRNGGYDAYDFLEKYIAYMNTPNNHRYTYTEECHRNSFKNHAAGLPPRRCGLEEKHIGGLVGLIPLVPRSEKALIANTNLEGDDAGRVAVPGALMAAAHGTKGFPELW